MSGKAKMDRLILDIKPGRDCPEHIFGTAKLRDLRIRPLFRDSDISENDYFKSVINEMTQDSILVSCTIFNPGKSDAEINIGLPDGPNRPDEKLLVKVVIYLTGEGYDVRINEVEKGIDFPPTAFSNPAICIGVSRKLVEDETGNFDVMKFFGVQDTLSRVYELLLS